MASYEEASGSLDGPRSSDPGKIKSYVYFISYGKRVKIGTCANVKTRLAALQIGIPGKARVRYVTPGDYRLERKLHERFAIDRVSGEWFQFSRAIQEWISSDSLRRGNIE